MSQPLSRQHLGTSEMQLWQQQLMYKQLQELQRRKQLQQLDQGSRQHNSLNHLSDVTKPVALNQSSMMTEMATNNAPNYMWPNNFVRDLPPMPGVNSQMLVAGNMNWEQSASSPSVQNVANSLMIPADHRQATQSLGYIRQYDRSLYGVPVSSTRGLVNQYPQFSRMSNDCDNLTAMAVDNQALANSNSLNTFQNNHDFPAERCLQGRTSRATQNFQGKGVFVNTVDILNSDETLGNFHQENDMKSSVRDQAFHGMQNQAFLSENSQGKIAEQVGTAYGVTSLDPTEQKILFGNDANRCASFSDNPNSNLEGLLHGHPIGYDCFGGFPSLQSGSWSALMQEAVGSSTSENGVQEEWNDLDFHIMDQPMLKPSIMSAEIGKQTSAWDDCNMQSASSLASRPLSLFNSTDADPSPSATPTFQHSYQSTPHKQFHQGQKQKQISEYGDQVQMPENNGTWMGQPYQQQNNFVDLQSDRGSWTHQQNLMSSNVAMQSDHMPNGWNDSYAVEPSGVNNSVYSTDGNMWRIDATHLNPNDRVGKPVETNGSFINTYGSVMNTDSLKFNLETNRQIGNSQQVVCGKTFSLDTCARIKDGGNVERNHTAANERQPQSWESAIKGTNEGDNYQHSKKQLERVSGESYASNNSNYIQQSDILSGENGSSTWSGYDQNPFLHRNLKPSAQSPHQAAGFSMLQNQLTLGTSRKPSYLASDSHFQGMARVFQESNIDVQAHVGTSDFNGHNLSNNSVNARKRSLMGVEDLCSGDDISVHRSTCFDPSTVNFHQNKNITQTSQNMIDLLPKMDHLRNCNTVSVPDKPAPSAVNAASTESSTQSFGLGLAPPSQKQLSQTMLSRQASASSGKSRHNNAEAGDNDQGRSSYAPSMQSLSQNKTSRRESLSNVSEDRPKVASDISKPLNSLPTAVPDIAHPGNQQHPQITSARILMQHQHKQRQNTSSSAGHELPHSSANFLVGNQTTLDRNASLPQQQNDSLDSAQPGQSVQKSFPTPVSAVPISSLATDVNKTSSLKYIHAERESMEKMIAGSHPVHKPCPFPETKPGFQSSIFGTSQQAGFSRMLHNVWTNISAQQHLAGLQTPKLTPQILQSIINNSRDTSLWSPQKTNERDNGGTTPEVGTSRSDLEQGGQRSKGASLNLPSSQVDVFSKTGMMSQGLDEVAWTAASDGGSDVSISSLVHLQQQDVSEGKSRQDAIPPPLASNAPTSAIVSSDNAGRTLISDVRQQNYSLLQQIQTMMGGDSEGKMLSGTLKAADYTYNPQLDWNTGQRFVSSQNPDFNIPVDGKVGASLQSSVPSDVKMLNLTSMDNEENNKSTSTATGGGHDPQNQMATLDTYSAGKSVKGMEHNQISPQMAPTWFKQYGSYQKGTLVNTNFNGQWNPNSSTNHYFFQKVQRSTDCNIVADPTNDSNRIDVHRHGSVSAMIVNKELPSRSLFPSVFDKGAVHISKKRKSETPKLISWHKVVTQGQQRMESISTAELDWAQATNRLFEKVDDEAQNMVDSFSIAQPRTRIILTTQLMQKLIPALPARILRVEADLAHANVTFGVAKAALADACSMIYCSEEDCCASLESERGTSRKFVSSVGDHFYSMRAEDYIAQSKKLENDFLRFYKSTLLHVRLECQELEKFSIINCLGKFHGRPHTDPTAGSSTTEIGTRGMFIQRYVTALPVPGKFPDGITYLSL